MTTRRVAVALTAIVAVLLSLAGPPRPAAAATGPTAVDDQTSVPTGRSVVLAGATNDRAGSAAIQPALTVFPTDGQPTGAAVSDGGRTIEVPKHGTFVINRDGSVTFTAWSKLTGDVAVSYRIVDAAGASDVGRLSVTVTAGGTTDVVVTEFDTEVAVTDLIANDIPGRNADGTPGTLDRSSVRFDPLGSEMTISADRLTATAPGLGVATLDRHGLLTWRAYPSSSEGGTSVDLSYDAQDTTVAADGTHEHHTYRGTAILTGAYNTDPDRVRTTDDRVATPYGASVTLPGLLDDRSNDAAPLRPDWSRFEVGAIAADTYLSTSARKIIYPGRGTFEIAAAGSVSYVPPPGYVGTDGVNMRVYTSELHSGVEELLVTVRPGPSGQADVAVVSQTARTPVEVLGSDTPGRNADGTAGSMDVTSVRFPEQAQPAGAVVSAYGRTLTVPGQGVYTADRTTGVVTFTPSVHLVGTVGPITYAARDTVARTDGGVVHNPVTATLTVTSAAPVARDDAASTPAGVAVEIPVLDDDRPGPSGAALLPASLRLRLTSGLPDGSRLSKDAKTLVVAGQGTFSARSDGTIRLTPVQGFVGAVHPIGYQVSDVDGGYARAFVTVQVQVQAGR